MQGTGHVGYMREKRRIYKGLVGKPEGTRSLGTLMADSHIACRAHAVPMPFPCRAVPLRV